MVLWFHDPMTHFPVPLGQSAHLQPNIGHSLETTRGETIGGQRNAHPSKGSTVIFVVGRCGMPTRQSSAAVPRGVGEVDAAAVMENYQGLNKEIRGLGAGSE